MGEGIIKKSRNGYACFYRILPLDEQCRELGNKCITPVSYFCNNLFLVDWNQNSLENIEFNDLFEFLYTMKYGEKIDEKNMHQAFLK